MKSIIDTKLTESVYGNNDLYEVRTTQVTVAPKGDPIFSEQASHVRIVDEAGGEFVEVVQEQGTIQIDPEEWPHLRAAIEGIISRCENPV